MGARINDRGSPVAPTEDVMLVQEAMRRLGLYDGPVDGMPGADTMIAVRAYKRLRGLVVDNSLDSAFVQHVRDDV